jgi:hypothetical protein
MLLVDPRRIDRQRTVEEYLPVVEFALGMVRAE